MRKLTFLMFLILLVWSCMPSQKAGTQNKTAEIRKDSTEYEITIIDPDFEQWYLLNYSPAKDYSNEYYHSKNQFGVTSWNEYFMNGKYHRVIENTITYDYNTDYGIEVNRKLYWYFRFIEEKYRIRLML